MAATSSSKPTAVHFTLVFFVLLSLVMGLMYYVTNRTLTEKIVETDKARKDLSDSKKANERALTQIDALKNLIGLKMEKVGEDDPAPDTVVGSGRADIEAHNRGSGDYSKALAGLSQSLLAVTEERNSLKDKLAAESKSYLDLEQKYKAIADTQSGARAKADRDLSDVSKTSSEQIASKDRQVTEEKRKFTELSAEYDTAKDGWGKEKKDLEGRITNLIVINTQLREEIEGIKKESFEIPDGLVTFVDQGTKTVWLNLGESDNLKPRVTFSVYKKTNQGMARGTADIKGSIEVTKITGPHKAEAKIIKDNIYDPIGKDDPVYTPLWSPGRTEEVAIVGLIDTDGDGRFKDRDLLIERIAANGAKVIAEAGEDGERKGGKLTVHTKFLVVGKIPEASGSAIADDQKKIENLLKHLTDMKAEARENGVRIISLSDFLAYIGNVHNNRLFKPGDEGKFTLKAGAASASTSQPLGQRTSSGLTSAAVSGDPLLKPKTSTGQTSKLFKGR